LGIQIIRATNTASGEVDINSMHELMKKYKPVLVSVTHVPNNTGMIQPVELIGDLCEQENILYAVDVCQSARSNAFGHAKNKMRFCIIYPA
jgi:cysteine desulfurase/selenocysteine lyase